MIWKNTICNFNPCIFVIFVNFQLTVTTWGSRLRSVCVRVSTKFFGMTLAIWAGRTDDKVDGKIVARRKTENILLPVKIALERDWAIFDLVWLIIKLCSKINNVCKIQEVFLRRVYFVFCIWFLMFALRLLTCEWVKMWKRSSLYVTRKMEWKSLSRNMKSR